MQKMFLKFFILFYVVFLPLVGHTYTFGTKVTSNGVPVKVFYKNGKTENYGTIIVAHGCYGMGWHEDRVGPMFADAGFNAVAVDSWWYRNIPNGAGAGSVCQTYSVTGAQRLEEIYKTVEWIKQQSWHSGNIFLIGFSHGAMAGMAASHKGPEMGIVKVAAFYPYCLPSDHMEPLIPTQVHIGSKDDWTPASRCRGMFNSYIKPFKYGEYYEYPNAHHGFDMWGMNRVQPGVGGDGAVVNRILRFDQESNDLAYARVLKFFKEPAQ